MWRLRYQRLFILKKQYRNWLKTYIVQALLYLQNQKPSTLMLKWLLRLFQFLRKDCIACSVSCLLEETLFFLIEYHWLHGVINLIELIKTLIFPKPIVKLDNWKGLSLPLSILQNVKAWQQHYRKSQPK